MVELVTTLREQAREEFAQSIEAQGPSWANTADSIRAGYANVWITAGIAALERVLRLVPDEADPDEGSRA